MTTQNLLSLLYIEDTIEDQLILKRTFKNNISAAIKLETASSVSEGLSMLSSINYDFVFLDYRLPDETGIEFLEELRAIGITVPVIFLTGVASERIVVQAIRAGIEEYLINGDIKADDFIDSIRKRLIKSTKPSQPIAELNDIENEAFNEIMASNTSNLNLVATKEGHVYNGLSTFVEKMGLEITVKVLKQLKEKGALQEAGEKRLLICPSCDSSVTGVNNYHYSCSNCLSKNVERVSILSHTFCGYTGDRRSFVTDSGLVCPNCKISLKERLREKGVDSKEGYLILGNSFECEDCETRFNRPEVTHNCMKCGEAFSYKNMGYLHVKEYKVS